MGSTAVVFAMVRGYGFLYIAMGIATAFILAYKLSAFSCTDKQVGSAIFYSLTNITARVAQVIPPSRHKAFFVVANLWFFFKRTEIGTVAALTAAVQTNYEY